LKLQNLKLLVFFDWGKDQKKNSKRLYLEIQMIDVTITSCGRQDLLIRTLDSFLTHADLPLGTIYIHEDSGIEGINDTIKKIFPEIVFLEPPARIGQIASLDALLARVQTPYYQALEDDWTFDKTGFMQMSLDILQEKEHISEVWLRYPKERNNHPCHGVAQKTASGTKYHILKTGFMGKWHGTSFAPSLRRLSDYQKLFPNGFASEIPWNPKNPLESEILVGRKFFKSGYRAATLLDGYCRHIGGNGRHVKPFCGL